MLSIEREFITLIYAIYAIDCIHWLKPGEEAFTRRILGGWHRQENKDGSFTLLGHMPVVRNPLDLRPGWIVCSDRGTKGCGLRAGAAHLFLERSLPERHFMTAFSALSALNLLVSLPATLALGLIASRWKFLSILILVTHATLCFELYSQAKRWRQMDRQGFWRNFGAIVLNPISAIRSNDVLCNSLFEVDLKETERIDS